jgi:hypothetical protein
MEIICEGQVRHGTIVLDASSPALPDGSRVRVRVEPLSENATTDDAYDFLLRMAEEATPSGIPDLAINIDHYLYGHPKVSDGPS